MSSRRVASPSASTADLWWKNAMVYCLDVETFYDSDGDGRGDFEGLMERLDYLAGLGIDTLWLMPFYPTPDRDDGYDITDFYNVDRRLGSLGQFARFMQVAEDRGLKVIADLVVNHTSVQHPWFQAASSSRESPFHDWYVWRDEPPEDGPKGIVFPDKESSNWAYHEGVDRYYLHRFYSHQADLNIDNPEVRDRIVEVIGFWLQQGLRGFRVDAVPFLLELQGMAGDVDILPHQWVRDMRAFIDRRKESAILLGEVNLQPHQQREYFGDEDGDELHMLFNFFLNQHLHLALVREDAGPIRKALEAIPKIPHDCQLANFITNHDELTLDKLSDGEREEVFAAFGPKKSMQLFGRGIRRRLPPMLEGDQKRLRLVYSLLFSLPGTPVLFYGEEIGMGENLDIAGRYSVRTPMQWTSEENGGFSTAKSKDVVRPLPEGDFGPKTVNVADQRRDPDSLLNWMERIIRRRKECPEWGWGKMSFLDVSTPAVMGHRCDWAGRTLAAFHNLSGKAQKFEVQLPPEDDFVGATDLLGTDGHTEMKDHTLPVKLGGYGYQWFRLQKRGERILP